jgi:uncharacterized LabA/DUF88 family protein
MKAARFDRYRWLDQFTFAAQFLPSEAALVEAKYFTARIQSPESKRERQSLYLDALESIEGLKIFEGRYLTRNIRCRNCHQRFPVPEEKMTDVSIATELLTDAFDDRFDEAVLITADSDLVPPVSAIRSRFPDKRITVVFPPKRRSLDLERYAHRAMRVFRQSLRDSQLPTVVESRCRKPTRISTPSPRILVEKVNSERQTP